MVRVFGRWFGRSEPLSVDRLQRAPPVARRSGRATLEAEVFAIGRGANRVYGQKSGRAECQTRVLGFFMPSSDPTALTLSEVEALGDRIATVAAEIDAANHELLTGLRSFDRAGGWHVQGALSCAHWLSWRTGLSLGPAREKVRVAGALAALPLIDEQLRRGKLSYSKTRALTRVATSDNEAELLDIAQHTTASQLEKICRLYRAHAPGRQAPQDAEDQRWVRSRSTDSGMVRIHIQLPADEAATVLEAIRVSAETTSAAGSARRADGVVAMAEATLAGTSVRAGKPPVEVMVHVDAATLTGHTNRGDGISAETSRRLLCDCGVVPSLEDDIGRIIDVGRKRRTIPPALRRALQARDGGCRFPGCTNTRCDAHHVEHWLSGGATNPDNLLLLCRRHHRYVHELGFRLDLSEDGSAAFYDAAGRLIPASGRVPGATISTMDGQHRCHDDTRRDARATVDPTANYPRWNGRPPEYDYIVNRMLERAGCTGPGRPEAVN